MPLKGLQPIREALKMLYLALVLAPLSMRSGMTSADAASMHSSFLDKTSRMLQEAGRPECANPCITGITLVVMFNLHIPIRMPVVQGLFELYRPLFCHVIFTGQGTPPDLQQKGNAHITWIPCDFDWYNNYLCLGDVYLDNLAAAGGLRPLATTGYLMIGDDVAFDPCKLKDLPEDQLWFTDKLIERATTDWHWQSSFGRSQFTLEQGLKIALEDMPTTYRHRVPSTLAPALTDFVYVPIRQMDSWLRLGHHFWRYGVMTEVATPIIVQILAGASGISRPANFNYVDTGMPLAPSEAMIDTGLTTCAPQSADTVESRACEHNLVFFHSFKFSNVTLLEEYSAWWQQRFTC